MAKPVHSELLSAAARGLLGDGDGVTVEVFAYGDGYVFGYANAFSGHGLYAGGDGEVPYATVEAAVAAANDVGDENGVYVGPGEGSGEFYGDLA